MNTNDARRAASARIAKDVRNFQVSGGKIQVLPAFGAALRDPFGGQGGGAYGRSQNRVIPPTQPESELIDGLGAFGDSDT